MVMYMDMDMKVGMFPPHPHFIYNLYQYIQQML
jgi:hypothetical protein